MNHYTNKTVKAGGAWVGVVSHDGEEVWRSEGCSSSQTAIRLGGQKADQLNREDRADRWSHLSDEELVQQLNLVMVEQGYRGSRWSVGKAGWFQDKSDVRYGGTGHVWNRRRFFVEEELEGRLEALAARRVREAAEEQARQILARQMAEAETQRVAELEFLVDVLRRHEPEPAQVELAQRLLEGFEAELAARASA